MLYLVGAVGCWSLSFFVFQVYFWTKISWAFTSLCHSYQIIFSWGLGQILICLIRSFLMVLQPINHHLEKKIKIWNLVNALPLIIYYLKSAQDQWNSFKLICIYMENQEPSEMDSASCLSMAKHFYKQVTGAKFSHLWFFSSYEYTRVRFSELHRHLPVARTYDVLHTRAQINLLCT